MEITITEQILHEIDEIVTALGQTDYEAFRTKCKNGAVLLANLARGCEMVGAMSRPDLVALVEQIPEPERKQKLRLLVGLKESLPMFGTAIIAAAQIFPQSQGGRPQSFKNRESKRQACRLVLSLISKGHRESEAKEYAAKKLGVSLSTVNRIWKERTELTTELSFEEFFLQFLTSLFAKDTSKPEDGKTIPKGSAGERT
ncbi:MAG: hypothetical protein ABSD88_03830 [Candidatus Korobacteraceae bacterium]